MNFGRHCGPFRRHCRCLPEITEDNKIIAVSAKTFVMFFFFFFSYRSEFLFQLSRLFPTIVRTGLVGIVYYINNENEVMVNFKPGD